MKQLSALEICFLASELAKISDSKLQQVYQPAKKQLVLQFHVRGKGRAVLKVRVPGVAYLAESKETGVTGFCSLLRKKLNNAVLRNVSQPGFERILKLDFSSKNGHFSLILELFSKGNIILLDDGKIVAAQEKQLWSSREIKLGQEYALPPAAADPRSISEDKVLELLKSTNKTDLVRFLALELSLGGLYAEELCLLSGMDKSSKPSEVGRAEVGRLLQSLKKFLKSELSPSVILEDSKAVDVVPVGLSYYKNAKAKQFRTFSEALETYYSSERKRPSRYDREISRVQAITDQQKDAIEAARQDILKYSRRGELIYENYQELKQLLETVNEDRKKNGWASIAKLQSSDKKLKSVDPKSGKLTVSL